MSEFGKLEYGFANFLAKYPSLKKTLKKNYQRINFFLNKKEYDSKLLPDLTINCLGDHKENGSFWGYYDKSPIHNNHFITHSFQDILSNSHRSESKIDILLDNKIISSTNSWNWQQGAMLSWYDDDTIIHNIYTEEGYKSKLVNIKDSTYQIIDFPIYTYHFETGLAYSLNFKRLALLSPDYGYFCHKSNTKLHLNDENDGVFKININDNESILIISFRALKQFNFKSSMKDSFHEVNHINTSPNGKRIMFLHRWYDSNKRKFSRLITANSDGSDMYMLSDDDMVSHCTWKNDREIVGWMNKSDIGHGYFTLRDRSQKFSQLGKNILNEDGHPSFTSCGRYMLTDTYPNRSRMSRILFYDTLTNKLLVLGEFLSPMSYFDENRCDLHPRFSENEKRITFDSAHEGKRQQYCIDISNIYS